jgi:hypothetical protein
LTAGKSSLRLPVGRSSGVSGGDGSVVRSQQERNSVCVAGIAKEPSCPAYCHDVLDRAKRGTVNSPLPLKGSAPPAGGVSSGALSGGSLKRGDRVGCAGVGAMPVQKRGLRQGRGRGLSGPGEGPAVQRFPFSRCLEGDGGRRGLTCSAGAFLGRKASPKGGAEGLRGYDRTVMSRFGQEVRV